MAGPLGVSFLPGPQDVTGGNGSGGGIGRPGAPRNPTQEAVKILSLRLPKFYGGQSLAPAPLLQAAGGMGQPAARGNVTAQALAGLAGLPPSMAMPQMPAPQLPSGLSGGTDTYGGWAQRESGLNDRGSAAPAPYIPPSFGPPPPQFVPGQTTDGGGDAYAPPGNWIDPRPSPEPPPIAPPTPEPVSGFSPWERPGRNQTLAEKYLEEVFGSLY